MWEQHDALGRGKYPHFSTSTSNCTKRATSQSDTGSDAGRRYGLSAGDRSYNDSLQQPTTDKGALRSLVLRHTTQAKQKTQHHHAAAVLLHAGWRNKREFRNQEKAKSARLEVSSVTLAVRRAVLGALGIRDVLLVVLQPTSIHLIRGMTKRGKSASTCIVEATSNGF